MGVEKLIKLWYEREKERERERERDEKGWRGTGAGHMDFKLEWRPLPVRTKSSYGHAGDRNLSQLRFRFINF